MHTKTLKIVFSLILAASFLAISLPAPVAASPAAQSCSTTYTVKAGDTLSGIAFKFDVSQESIIAANGLKEPYVLQIDQKICIPGTTSTTTTTTTTASKAPTFTVKFDGPYLDITTSNFPTQTSYYVRVGVPGRFWYDTTWYKLGTFTTKKTGPTEKAFRLVKDLRGQILIVCVKNALDDAVLCKYAVP